MEGGTAYTGISASGQARLHLGNNHTSIANHYTLQQRRSDETLSENDRNHRFLKAAAEGQVPRVDYLRHLGADLDYSDEIGFTALHHAVYEASDDASEVAEVLLQAGADVNAESLDLGTPLCLAAMLGRVNVANTLLKHRAHIGIHLVGRLNGTALHCACFSGNTSIVQLLIDRGANVQCMSETYVNDYKEGIRQSPIRGIDKLIASMFGRRWLEITRSP